MRRSSGSARKGFRVDLESTSTDRESNSTNRKNSSANRKSSSINRTNSSSSRKSSSKGVETAIGAHSTPDTSTDRVQGDSTSTQIRLFRGNLFYEWVTSHPKLRSLDLSNMTSEDFVQQFVKVVTQPGERLFDLLPSACKKVVEYSDVGPSDYVFVSHFWRRPVFELFNYINHTGHFFWVDLVCVMQHKGEHQDADLAAICSIVEGAKEVWAMLDEEGRLFTRCWCCYEVVTRILAEKNVHFEYPNGLVKLGLIGKPEEQWNLEQSLAYCNSQLEILQIMRAKGVDIAQCEALYEQDRKLIHEWIQDKLGFEKANRLILENLDKRVMEMESTLKYLSVSN